MNFSPDKKPTEPGQYWASPSHNGANPFVASVHALTDDGIDGIELNVQLVNNWAPVEVLNWLWGDRVEFPAPEVPGSAPSPTNNGLPEDCPGVAYWDGSRFYNRVPGAQMLVSEVEILPVGSRDRLEKLEAALQYYATFPEGYEVHDKGGFLAKLNSFSGRAARALSKEKK